jgi:peptidoglycan/xylan/chitin deacetylase (PgdA/CDA1 family)
MKLLLRRCWAKVERPFASFLGFPTLLKSAGAGLICPVYHVCRDQPPPWWNNRYRIKTLSDLEKDLDFLATLGPFVSLNDLLNWRHGKSPKPKGCFLSFDDGYRELYDTVAPLLLRKGIPATFFVISSIIDNRRPFHEDLAGAIQARLTEATLASHRKAMEICQQNNTSVELLLQRRVPNWQILEQLAEVVDLGCDQWLQEHSPYLTSDHLRQMASQGFGIGAHSVDHPLFCEISDQDQRTQVEQSLADISDRLQLSYRIFAFPYGEFNIPKFSLSSLLSTHQLDFCFGTRGIIEDEFEPRLVQRMLAEDHSGTFSRHVHQELRSQRNRVWLRRGVVHRTA